MPPPTTDTARSDSDWRVTLPPGWTEEDALALSVRPCKGTGCPDVPSGAVAGENDRDRARRRRHAAKRASVVERDLGLEAGLFPIAGDSACSTDRPQASGERHMSNLNSTAAPITHNPHEPQHLPMTSTQAPTYKTKGVQG